MQDFVERAQFCVCVPLWKSKYRCENQYDKNYLGFHACNGRQFILFNPFLFCNHEGFLNRNSLFPVVCNDERTFNWGFLPHFVTSVTGLQVCFVVFYRVFVHVADMFDGNRLVDVSFCEVYFAVLQHFLCRSDLNSESDVSRVG